jgi:hypothetical protein
VTAGRPDRKYKNKYVYNNEGKLALEHKETGRASKAIEVGTMANALDAVVNF